MHFMKVVFVPPKSSLLYISKIISRRNLKFTQWVLVIRQPHTPIFIKISDVVIKKIFLWSFVMK